MQEHREQERILRDLLHQPARRRALLPLLAVLRVSHSLAEETVIYPSLKNVGYVGLTKQCQSEHLNGDRLLAKLLATSPGDDTFEVCLRSLTEVLTGHHEREELELLLPLRKRLDPEEIDELTDTFAEQRALLMIGVGGATRQTLQQQAANFGILGPESLPRFRLEETLARRARTSCANASHDLRDGAEGAPKDHGPAASRIRVVPTLSSPKHT